ncbi:pre-rRNA-processing protein esf1 [Malassezia yamatoensis]|uniref:Pre-rRNA-processing protein esf1 n=1 Tax=Malassezia yamatoensis TaxID=253288 RepID=A0AAJ6CJM3_9BASI|nr:pre-rRNA-processing protein esf1 [Malassezia yamatoensis]
MAVDKQPTRDERFARVHTDPRFRKARKDDTKVVLDDRFKDVLQKKKGKKLDRFGRRTSQEDEELQRLYRLEDEKKPSVAKGHDLARGEVELESSSDEEDSDDDTDQESVSDSESQDDRRPVVIGKNPAAVRRAEAYDSDHSIDLNEEQEFDPEVVAQLDRQASGSSKQREQIARGDDTCRIAVVNMDWDHVHAQDLYKVFASLVNLQATRSPADALMAQDSHSSHQALNAVHGQVKSVRVYVSDFGRERLAKEDLEGPPRSIFKSTDDQDTNASHQVEEGAEFDEEALRKYQLERLRYYYAIATFDSKQSARFVYNQIDGTEMERSANLFDLRFVPDDMTFPDGEQGRDADFREEALNDTNHYEGLDYKTDALRHSRVRLTWDMDDPRRMKVTHAAHRKGQDFQEDEVKTYLASDSEDEDKNSAQSRDRLRSLLTAQQPSAFDDAVDEESMYQPKSKDHDTDMQITFVPALASNAEKAKPIEEETTMERYLRKQKERREKKKAKAQLKAPSQQDSPAPTTDEKTTQESTENTVTPDFQDAFFASDQEMDFDEALRQELEASPPKSRKQKAPQARDEKPVPDEQIEDVSGSDNEQHFSLQDIVRAEKLQNRKLSKHQRKREAKREAKRTPLLQPNFAIDTKDPRFTALKQDHRFAIDPNHPGFVKTAGMQKLLEESRQRSKSSNDVPPTDANPTSREKSSSSTPGSDLAALVSSIKRNAPVADRRTKKPRS